MIKRPCNWWPALAIIVFVFIATVVSRFTGTDEKLLYLVMIGTAIFVQITQK